MNVSRAHDSGFRLIQLSDCHLPANPDRAYRGLNADAGLEAVLRAVQSWQPDAILLTGDLSEDASSASYERLAAHVNELNVPIFALPGNHDDPVVMERYFPEGPYSGPWIQQVGGWNLALLNSAQAGRIEGCLADADLEALRTELAVGKPGLIALHHQPIPVDAPWIDRYMLASPEEFLRCVEERENLRIVTWGHVHQVFQQQVGQACFMSAPSSAANSLPRRQRFSLDDSGPACRWFELCPDGRFESGVIWGQSKNSVFRSPV